MQMVRGKMAEILNVLFDGDLVVVGIRDSMCFFLNFTTGREDLRPVVFPIGHATSASELKKFPKDEVADLRWKIEDRKVASRSAILRLEGYEEKRLQTHGTGAL